MAKSRVLYVCQDCGSEQSKWIGQCPDCGAWNTLTQFARPSGMGAARAAAARPGGYAGEQTAVRTLAEIELRDVPRLPTGFDELDRVLGGGLVPGSVNLVGGPAMSLAQRRARPAAAPCRARPGRRRRTRMGNLSL